MTEFAVRTLYTSLDELGSHELLHAVGERGEFLCESFYGATLLLRFIYCFEGTERLYQAYDSCENGSSSCTEKGPVAAFFQISKFEFHPVFCFLFFSFNHSSSGFSLLWQRSCTVYPQERSPCRGAGFSLSQLVKSFESGGRLVYWFRRVL
jgi:hypothetical protein